MEKLPKTGIGNLDRKLTHLERKLLELIKAIHEPDKFVSVAEETIQAIRHFTFGVQANKDTIPNFDEWYTVWQELMKNDTFMKWIKDKRTELVHDDINFASSNASIEYVIDYGVSLGITAKDVFVTTAELIHTAKIDAKKNPELLNALGKISREYIVNIDDAEYQLIDVLGYGVDFMVELSADLARYMVDNNPINPKVEKISNLVDPKDTEITFKVRSGKIIRERHKRIDRDNLKLNMDAIKKRYGIGNPIDFSEDDPEKLIIEIKRAAKQMLLIDGFHITMLHARKSKDHTWVGFSPMFRDRTEKFLFSKQLAEDVKKSDYDRIIMVTESWITQDVDTATKYLGSGKQIEDMDNKSEALCISYIAKDGTCLDTVMHFERDDENNINFTKEYTEKGKPMYQGIFWTVMVAWGLVNPEDAVKRTASL